jgi:hypothetical protein
MPVYYDTEAEEFMIGPDTCPDCGEPLYDTGCDAPGCTARCCMNCGTGCDAETDPEGRCAAALAEEDEEERCARFDAERAAFGLPPLREDIP